ncbi:MAG: sensor histidine kinase [Acidimicrobiales bacterium]
MGHDAWMARYGWLLAAIWLVFLVFPLAAVWAADDPTPVRVMGTALIGLFAALYIHGFRRQAQRQPWPPGPSVGAAGVAAADRAGVAIFAVLVVITVAAQLTVGVAGLGLVSFVVSFAVFHLAWRAVWATFAAGLAAVVLVPWWLGSLAEVWYLALIVFAVGVSTMLVRVVEVHGDERAGLQTRLAVGDERTRVARDVHDVLGHSLTAVILKAELCQRLLEGVEATDDAGRARVAACRDQLAELQTVSRSALAEIRSTVGGLRTAHLADELVVARTVLADAGVRLQVVGDPMAGSEPLRPLLAWVVREAVTNVVRHARATTCRIELDPEPCAPGPGRHSEAVLLRIDDDGVGMGPGAEGNGLRGLRERVEAAGATLRIRSDGGTRLEVVVETATARPPVGRR